jgi:exodeoxyribonuclease V beta subunit
LEGARREGLAESARNLYVALTRARHRTVLYFGAFGGFERSALSWLFGTNPDPAALRDAIKPCDDEQLLKACKRAAADCPNLRVRTLGGAPPHRMHITRPFVDAPDRVPTRALKPRTVSSFSGMIAGSDAHGDLPEALDPASGEGVEPPADVTQADVPAGAALGTAVHGVLERLDFVGADAASVGALVDEVLAEQGLAAVGDPGAWRDALVAGLLEVIDSPMCEDGPRLRDIGREDRIDEMAFWLPVAAPSAELAPAAVAGALGGAANLPDGYVERLRALPFLPFSGFLKGFVDLIFRWNGRYYLVDYKSNHLGRAADSYRHPKLEAAMVEHHYCLQYQLYAVALHRYLSARVEGFSWERDFGGVFYLFLRGMHPSRPGAGVYADRPDERCVLALSAALGGR